MAKNTSNSKFRKVNVDAYDENSFREEDQTEVVAGGPDEGEVMGYLNQGKNGDALHAVLKCPPIGSKNKEAKERALMLVMRVLTAFKTSEIEKHVKALDRESVDILMKYIYKGFELSTDNNSAALLVWHEQAVSAGGLGSIVRVLTDRKG